VKWAGAAPKLGLIGRHDVAGWNCGAGATRDGRDNRGQGQRHTTGWHKGKSCGVWLVQRPRALLWMCRVCWLYVTTPGRGVGRQRKQECRTRPQTGTGHPQEQEQRAKSTHKNGRPYAKRPHHNSNRRQRAVNRLHPGRVFRFRMSVEPQNRFARTSFRTDASRW